MTEQEFKANMLDETTPSLPVSTMKYLSEKFREETKEIANPSDFLKNQKKDQGKVRMDLLPPNALKGIAEIFTFGANKYSDWGWAKGIQHSRIYGAMQRHLNAWYGGEEVDPETGLSHLYHAGCNIMILIELQKSHPELDDRHYKQ